ncbi:MAG: Uma2 family endonuclease [Synechococcales bacterium]|nr:Uma2 family endonuclease [Synechococcales bacterium]
MVQTSVQSSSLAIDKRQIHPHRTWEQFKLLQKGLEHSAGVRLFFFQGTVEVLMPGRYHEIFKKIIASLLEAFLLDHEIAATPTGSMDREAEGMAAAQPDESYEIGDFKLVIEVIVSHGAIAKLELYKTLTIDEVWFWEDGILSLYHLLNGQYQRVDRSQIPALAQLDITVLTQCILMGETQWNQAVKTLRSAHPL